MGKVYVIRHGQRFPVKDFSHLKSAFGDETVKPGELTEVGRKSMRELGANFKGVPIVRAKFSGNRRCEDSLTEFLEGAAGSVQPERLGDTNFTGFKDFVENCDTTAVANAFKSTIKDRKALDELNEKYLPGLEGGFIRDCASGAIVDSFSILDDRGVQKMTTDLAELDLEYALALTRGLHGCLADAMRKTILEAFGVDGVTVVVASDMHLLFVLERLAPQFIDRRPPFGAVVELDPSEEEVLLRYRDQEVKIPLTEFRRKIQLDIPESHS